MISCTDSLRYTRTRAIYQWSSRLSHGTRTYAEISVRRKKWVRAGSASGLASSVVQLFGPCAARVFGRRVPFSQVACATSRGKSASLPVLANRDTASGGGRENKNFRVESHTRPPPLKRLAFDFSQREDRSLGRSDVPIRPTRACEPCWPAGRGSNVPGGGH
jgi:hypothetical protein